MRTEAEILLAKLERLYVNIYNLLEGFQQASTDNKDVMVNLIDESGTNKTVTINSFQQVLSELKRLTTNVENLTSYKTYNITKDGVVTTYNKITPLKAEPIFNIEHGMIAGIDNNREFVENLMFPIVKLPIILDRGLAVFESIRCKQYNITYGFENIPDNVTELELEHLIANNQVIGTFFERNLSVQKKEITLFGKFNVEDYELVENNLVKVKLDTLLYGSTDSLGKTITLKVNDVLVDVVENNEFIVKEIDINRNTVTLQSTMYNYRLSTGIGRLQFSQQSFDSHSNVVMLPIKPNSQMVCFFSTVNSEYVGYPSAGFKLDTTDITVSDGSKTFSIDEYFTKHVTNFSEYLNSLINETSIPYSLGIKPDKPVLNPANFKVVQINKHLVDTKTKQEIEQLNKQKQSIQNEIEYKTDLIKRTQNEIDTLKFNSLEEKTFRENRIIALQTEVSVLKSNMLSVVRDIDVKATRDGLKNITPKYRIIGYWEIQDPMFSAQTKPQHIIKYEVQYRYLTKGIDTFDVTSYKMIDKGQEITVAFSNWNEYASSVLNKVESIDGTIKWESNSISSVDDITINQCSISINESEAVEIRIRAVSEAGYPISPMKSEWSDTIRIDFPDYLKDSNIRHTVQQNVGDLQVAEFNQVLINHGLLQHIAGQIHEGDKLFLHNAKDISSGQYTPEQKNIPLDVCIQMLINEINGLKGVKSTDNVLLSFIDTNNERYNITQNSTLEIFAGNYSDEVGGVLEEDKFGEIITKRYYISIKNNNTVPIEIRSLIPNSTFLTTDTFKPFKEVPVVIDTEYQQKPGQIIYFRNAGLFNVNDSDVLIENVTEANKPIPSNYINSNAAVDSKTVYVYGQSEPIAIAKNMLDQPFEFIAYTNEIKQQIPSINFDKEIERLAKHGDVLAKHNKQKRVADGDTIGFSKIIDKYSIGKNTCGAWLYPRIDKLEKFVTNGNNATSSLVIEPNSEILIPIDFEYRMSDRLGKVYPMYENDPLGLNLEYKKKLGVSLHLNNTEFRFDIQVSAKFKSKISVLDNKNVATISGIYTRESKKTLI